MLHWAKRAASNRDIINILAWNLSTIQYFVEKRQKINQLSTVVI
jgi:hypothetical protein